MAVPRRPNRALNWAFLLALVGGYIAVRQVVKAFRPPPYVLTENVVPAVGRDHPPIFAVRAKRLASAVDPEAVDEVKSILWGEPLAAPAPAPAKPAGERRPEL